MKHDDLLKQKREPRVELLATRGSQENKQESSRRAQNRRATMRAGSDLDGTVVM